MFFLGPRQTGKSTLLKMLFPKAMRYDLLLSTEYQRLLRKPNLIREQCLAAGLNAYSQRDPLIRDEIQKIPALLDEVHWLIEDRDISHIFPVKRDMQIYNAVINVYIHILPHKHIRPELP